MRQLNGRYTQTFNRRRRRVDHLFQGRFIAQHQPNRVIHEAYRLHGYRLAAHFGVHYATVSGHLKGAEQTKV